MSNSIRPMLTADPAIDNASSAANSNGLLTDARHGHFEPLRLAVDELFQCRDIDELTGAHDDDRIRNDVIGGQQQKAHDRTRTPLGSGVAM
ncbi:hypothetical protein [Novosphingobium sp. ES2-1]|uniref:hypothetical protein n=1 Tax=Novosphingobium sp. ES2-1 TaxID=2780074 RepID=UPI0018805BEF|nr:hypothetical protein [Novosphingobium sp. ES2-1]QOV95271.1 hypothetical protein IM701_07595 [Novosphingobium sp. ES2-1]